MSEYGSILSPRGTEVQEIRSQMPQGSEGTESPDDPNKTAPGLSDRGHWEKLERETGFEPATLSLGS